MKKSLHNAKANILKNKSASISLFIIILIVSALMTISLSVLLGADRDFRTVIDRCNTVHSMFIFAKNMYDPSFEDVIKNDNRVAQYEVTEVLAPGSVEVNYGGKSDTMLTIFNMDNSVRISPPKVVEEDLSISRERAIYLPAHAKNLNINIGDDFVMIYKNKPLRLIVAGFFQTNELAVMNMGLNLKLIAPDACYQMLKQQFGTSVWVAVRFNDIGDSQQFNRDFASAIDIDLIDFSFNYDADGIAETVKTPVIIIFAVIIVFALLIALISLYIARFRVISNIEDTMHEIGVLKASGYTSAQIIACYIVEYGIISVPAVLLGVAVSLPAFSFVRQVMISTSGFMWSLGADITMGLIAALFIVIFLLLIVLRSCRRIKKLPPVIALSGGTAATSYRRNFFPLNRGAGSVQARLGLKNSAVFIKTYAMIGVAIAIMSVAVIVVTALYQSFVLDTVAFARMAGFEMYDVELSVTRHTDADALAVQLGKMPEVRKTSMFDWGWLQVEGIDATSYVTNDFSQMESMYAHDGRFPKYDNEVAIPKLFADQSGKVIGDSVAVRAAGVSREYIITGFFSAINNMGRTAAMTLEGYQRLDPNYKRGTVTVYLCEGVTVNDFAEKIRMSSGVLNVYKDNEGGKYAAAKAVAEEKISNYLEHYDIDSVEYSVIYNGGIILSGSSGGYQIEKIVDWHEKLFANVGTYMQMISLIVQVVAGLSLIIIFIIISMTIRGIVSKRRREIGTLKAVGFTTKQISRQLLISFAPCAVVGTIIGCIAGTLLTSPAITLLFSGMGAYGTVISVNPLVVLLTGALFLLVSFASLYVSARRIKNISAYELIADGQVVQRRNKKIGIKKFTAVLTICLMLISVTSYIAAAADTAGDTWNAPASGVNQRLYGIGSVSKVFTAAAVMKLADQGMLDIDAPVTVYIPEFQMADARYAQITPGMLLNHSSGLMGTTGSNALLLGDNDTYLHDIFLDMLKIQTLKHDPGDRSIYCNDGFTLAEILIERVSGESFTDYIEQNFSAPLGLRCIRTPQSDFDRGSLADVYMGNTAMKPESLGMIGSGGIYATMDDLCRFATIFMDSSDGSVLSRQAINEMTKNQHKNEMVSPGTDTAIRYGLGWDCVEAFPFSQYGIKALTKGGSTGMFHTNLTVLPEYDLAAAVSSSGRDGLENLIAQEIIIAVLKEEGILPENAGVSTPDWNRERSRIPENIKTRAGVYDAGILGRFDVEFTDDTLVITQIMTRNERPQEYIYNAYGEFISTNGDFIGFNSTVEGARGVTKISFTEPGYLVTHSYEELPGLGLTAIAMPFAKKIENNPVSTEISHAWDMRNYNEYLLVSEKYSSMDYINFPIAKTLTDPRVYGYVGMGIYRGSGALFNMARIIDENTALSCQSTPTMTGRDTNNICITEINGVGYLNINNHRYIDAAAAISFSEIGDAVIIGTETLWVDIDDRSAGQIIGIETPENGAWFVYDNRMNCIASSLEANLRKTVILPEGGRLAFAGESGAAFGISCI